MFDSESKTWLHVLVVFGVAMAMLFGVSWLAGESLRHNAEECQAKNGFMIKGMESFHCVDKSMLK